MSQTIDDRLVRLAIENKQFEAGVAESIKSLKALSSSIDDLSDLSKSLESVSDALKLNTAATKTNNFLHGMEAVYKTAKGTYKVVSSIIKTAEKPLKMVSSLTGLTSILKNIEAQATQTFTALTGGAIGSGFEEYELKVNSVRTILASVEKDGKTIDDVSRALDRLNKYADDTIYNFGQMTKNIGYFTVAGVDLETSVSAIKGFSNLAALQGVDSTAMARGAYQLSQALSSGYVKLLDWRSLETSQIAGKGFQDILIDLAKKNGVNYDNYLKKYKSFRETLQEGWLTTDIMMKALNLYSGDFGDDFVKEMSGEKLSKELKNTSFASRAYQQALDGDTSALDRYGLKLEELQKIENEEERNQVIAKAIGELTVDQRKAETIDYLVRNYGFLVEEAEKYWEMSVKANKAAKEVTTVSKLLETLKEAAQSGWTESWEIILGDINGAKVILTAVSDEIGGLIEKAAKRRNKILKEWKEATKTVDENGVEHFKFYDAIANFYEGIKGLASNFKAVFRSVFGEIDSKWLIDKTNGFYDLSVRFKEFVLGAGGASEKLKTITSVMQSFANVCKIVFDFTKDRIGGFFKLIGNLFDVDLTSDTDDGLTTVTAGMRRFGKASGEAHAVYDDFVGALSSGTSKFEKFWNVAKVIGRHTLGLVKDYFVDTKNLLLTELGGTGYGKRLIKAFSNIKSRVDTFAKSIREYYSKFSGLDIKQIASILFSDLSIALKNASAKIKGLLDRVNVTSWFEGLRTKIKKAILKLRVSIHKLKFKKDIFKWANGIYKSFKASFTTLFSKIRTLFDTILSKFTGKKAIGFGSVGGGGGGGGGAPNSGNAVLDSIVSKIVPTKQNTLKYVSKVKAFVEDFVSVMRDVAAWIKDRWASVSSAFSSAWTWVSQTAAPAVSSAFTRGFEFIGKAAEKVKDLIDWLLPVLNSLGFWRLSSALLGFSRAARSVSESSGNAITSVGDSFSNISSSFETMITGIKASFDNVITGFVTLISQVGKTFRGYARAAEFKAFAKLLLGLSALVAATAGAIYVLSTIDKTKYENAKQGLILLGITCVALMGLVTLMSRFGGSSFKMASVGVGMLALAASLLVMISVFRKFDELAHDEKFMEGIGATLALLVPTLIAIVGSIAIMNANTGTGKVTGILQLAIALAIIAKVIKNLSLLVENNKEGQVGKAFGIIAGIITIAGLFELLGHIGPNSGNKPKGLLSLAALIWVTSTIIVDLTNLMNSANEGTVLKAAGIVAGLIVLAGAFELLSHIGPNSGNKSTLTSLIGLALAMQMLAQVVSFLAGIDENKIGRGTTALAVVATVLVGSFLLIANTPAGKTGSKIVMLVGIIASFRALISMIDTIGRMKTSTLLKGGVTILAIGTMLGLLVRQVSKLGPNVKNVIPGLLLLGTIAASFYGFILFAKALTSMDSDSLMKSAGSFALVLTVIIAALKVVSKIKFWDSVKTIGVVTVFLAAIVGLIAGLGIAFDEISGLESRVKSGKEALKTVGEAIGSFFSGIIDGVSDSYPTIGSNLAAFGTNAAPFFDEFMPKLRNFKMEDFQKLTEFTGALGNLGTDKWKNEFSLGMGLGWDSEKDVATNIFDILASRFTRKKQLSDIFTMKQDFTEYATALSGLMGSIQSFMTEASGFTSEQLSSVNGSFTLVRDFLNGLDMKLPSLAEVEGDVDGGKFSLGKLGKGLLGKIFGDGKIGASASSTGIDAKIKQNFADLGTMLSSVLDAADDFMINVSSKVTEDSFPAIEKAFNLVTGYITSVSNLSMPEETTVEGGAGSGSVGLGSKKFGLDMKGIGGAYVQRASLAALGVAASAILNASETFITSTANINKDSFPAIEKAFDLVATYVQSFSGMSLPVENTTAGGGLAAGGGWGFAGAIGGAYVQRSALSVLGNVASSILASASDFITKTADINEDSFPAIEKAFNLVSAYIQNFNGLTLPSETSLWGGNIGAMGFGVTAFSYIKRASLESLGDAASKILEAAGPFIEKAKDFEGKDQEITTAFGHVTTFIGALSEIKLPEEKSLKALFVGLFGGFKYTENAKLSELTTFVTGLLREVGAFITLATSTSGKKAEIDDAFKHVTDLLSAINALTLKKEYSTAAGLLAASSEAVAIAGYAKDTYTNFENLTTFITTVLPAVSNFIDSAKNLTSDETNRATTLFTCVTSLLGGISKMELPTETETASGVLAWSGNGSQAAILGHSGEYKAAFDNLATVLPTLISSVQDFVTATKDLSPEGATASATALGAVSTLLGAVNNFTLPEEMSDGWGLFAETNDGGTIAGRTKTIRADFGKFARELGRIITSCQSIFEYASKLSGEELGRVQTAINLLNAFLSGFNDFKLPEETKITYFGAFKGRVESYKTSFDEMVGSISGENGLLNAFAGFIKSVEGLTESENNSVSSAVNDLVSFLNGLNDFKPPKKATKEWWGIAEQFTTLGDIANALPDLGTNLGKFYTNFSDIEGSVEAFGSLYDIMGGESAKSAAVVGFLSDSVQLFKNLWTLNDQYGTLQDKYWIDPDAIGNIVGKLGDFVEALSESVGNGDLDYAFGSFADFGSKIFEKITAGFSNTDSITTLRDALSTALTTALTPDAMPDEVGSFDSVIAQINALLEEGIDTAPTIRPVLDLSQLTADVKSMDELFTAGGIIRIGSAKQNAEEANVLSAQLSQHTSTVVNAINSMGAKIDNLGNSIKNIKIVLNTGILAGAMAPDIDKALGARSDTTRRGSATSSVPSYVV